MSQSFVPSSPAGDSPPGRLLWSLPETMYALHIGESMLHKAIREGELQRVRIGARSFVTVDSVNAYLERRVAAERAAAEVES